MCCSLLSRDGSLQKTPAHNFSQFKFNTYAPVAFRSPLLLKNSNCELFLIFFLFCFLRRVPVSDRVPPRKFRNIFSIERDKFLVSLCTEPMIELSNPGASGSIFYVTQVTRHDAS